MLGELPNVQETRQAFRVVHHVQGLKRPGVVTELSLTSWEVQTFAIVVSLISRVVRGFTGFGGPAIMVLALTQFRTPPRCWRWYCWSTTRRTYSWHAPSVLSL